MILQYLLCRNNEIFQTGTETPVEEIEEVRKEEEQQAETIVEPIIMASVNDNAEIVEELINKESVETPVDEIIEIQNEEEQQAETTVEPIIMVSENDNAEVIEASAGVNDSTSNIDIEKQRDEESNVEEKAPTTEHDYSDDLFLDYIMRDSLIEDEDIFPWLNDDDTLSAENYRINFDNETESEENIEDEGNALNDENNTAGNEENLFDEEWLNDDDTLSDDGDTIMPEDELDDDEYDDEDFGIPVDEFDYENDYGQYDV